MLWPTGMSGDAPNDYLAGWDRATVLDRSPARADADINGHFEFATPVRETSATACGGAPEILWSTVSTGPAKSPKMDSCATVDVRPAGR